METWVIVASIAGVVEALAVLITVLFAIRQLRITNRQLREANRTRSLDGFLALSSDMERLADARGLIYRRLRPHPKEPDVGDGVQSGSEPAQNEPEPTEKEPAPTESESEPTEQGSAPAQQESAPFQRKVVPVLCTDRDYDLKKLPDKLKEAVESVCVALDRMGVLVLKGLIPEDVAFSMYFDVVLRIWYLVGPFVKQEQKNRRPGVWMKHFEVLSKGTLGYPRRIPGIGRASGTGGCA